MASEIMEALITLAQEKHIDELYVLDRLEQSLAETYSKILDLKFGDEVKVTIDRTTGKVYVYRMEPQSIDDDGNWGDFEAVDVTPKDASRQAALHAKAEINSIVRSAGREQIYEEFSKRIGEVITGTVLQVTNDFTILKIREGVEAELPHFDRRYHPEERNERPDREYYTHNQRLRAVIIDVRDPKALTNGTATRGEHNRPAIVVSRTHPDLIRRLLENEVPEVYEGVVEVKNIAREPGMRSKVSVTSMDPHLDPVGACVGPKGQRIRTVVAELKGERIDVVEWNQDPAKYVASALSPAKVTKVLADTENQHATVIVPDDQLSLAIGKEGQNARLAAHLTGWHIDITPESFAANLMGSIAPMLDDSVSLDEDGRCVHVDAKGVRCRNQARPGSQYCSVHRGAHRAEEEIDSLI